MTTIDATLHFTVAAESSNTLAVPTGSFVYDDATNTLLSYTVQWNGAVFDYQPGFASVSLSNLEGGGNWCAEQTEHSPYIRPMSLPSLRPFFQTHPVGRKERSR